MSKKRPQPRRDFRDSAYAALHRKGVVTAVYLVLRVLVILTLISQFLHGNFENVFFCVLSLVLFLMPTILERQLQIDLPNVLEIVILLFIFSAWILGEVQTYYTIIPYWDTMLHTLNGFLCAAIGFSLVDLLNRHERVSLSLSPVECAMDQIFMQDMQKDTIVNAISSVMLDPTGSQRAQAIRDITDVIVVTGGGEEISLGLGGYLDIGLLDTMEDLLVNFIGAAVFSFVGYFYVKNRGKGWFARNFIPQVLPDGESDGETDRPEE